MGSLANKKESKRNETKKRSETNAVKTTPSQKRKIREKEYRKTDKKIAKKRLSQRLSLKSEQNNLLEQDKNDKLWTPIKYELPKTKSFLEEKDLNHGDFIDPNAEF